MVTQGSLIIDEMRAWIGRDLGSVTSEVVTQRDIRRYAQAIADYNPLYLDEEYAKKTPYGGIIAPRLFFGVMGEDPNEPDLRPDGTAAPEGGTTPPMPESLPRRMAGGSEFEFFLPVRPGDAITVNRRIADIFARQGRTGSLVFTVTEMTYTNQRGEVVAICRNTLIAR